MVVLAFSHVRFLNGKTLRLGGVDVIQGDGVKTTRHFLCIVSGKTDTILIISAENVGKADVPDALLSGEGTMLLSTGTISARILFLV